MSDVMTTVRAQVSKDEHEAIKRSAKKCGMTISDFTRTALSELVGKTRGIPLEKMAEMVANDEKFYQPDLFEL